MILFSNFRYKGRIIYNTRYQESCGSSTNNLSSGHGASSTGLGQAASGGVANGGGASGSGGRETRRSSRFRSSGVAETATSASVHGSRSSSSGKNFCQMTRVKDVKKNVFP